MKSKGPVKNNFPHSAEVAPMPGGVGETCDFTDPKRSTGVKANLKFPEKAEIELPNSQVRLGVRPAWADR